MWATYTYVVITLHASASARGQNECKQLLQPRKVASTQYQYTWLLLSRQNIPNFLQLTFIFVVFGAIDVWSLHFVNWLIVVTC